MAPQLTARLLERPNRPRRARTEGIVVHAMGEFVGGVPAWDFLREQGVDAHRLIDPQGAIVQTLPDVTVAYHAGKSRHGTTEGLNFRALGVELLVAGSHDLASLVAAIRGRTCPFLPAQLAALVWCCRDWVARFEGIRWILGHEHVSGPWIREDPKADPGPWLELGKLWHDVWGTLPAPDLT